MIFGESKPDEELKMVKSGASIISRVMGLILSSVAVSSILAGIKDYFAL
jgi:small neutral amino acid transporter SnatA (MarC family)